ncbi:uncharacterized protein SPPG_05125 [Spizellomyces punctatus DAOM BR117]|uniref:YAP binding domain-containing protein n=1 Tax=Spizellomyces punctatus (strain DAOM BR117) TaxID=645134 RepID=A0A0L0HE65_SPIPD|nr:uncharacterized protein SPPG_05125 [Spizellomyces punctatus DAOM BR117]KNC99745.1 hypothetical protein SPPG_05125 [Spizellomyces punctatus DAOM BR117]|eukprot:XP_016607785.1 hypothetical protein SPPG_05125 [Spizellomyces punctatus DAOM BR117]
MVTTGPSLGRLKMQALLAREQEILKAKDESPYPTPVEETSQSLLLKSLARSQPTPFPEKLLFSYFYLYLDVLGDKELERHSLARFSRLESACESVPVSSVCRDRFPRVGEMCEKGGDVMLVKIHLNLHHLTTGDFRNISVFESTRAKTLECTTTVYHFGQRILETKQVQYPLPASPTTTPTTTTTPQRHLYHFDFVKQFFSAFLAGFQCLRMDVERMIAIDNLSVMQVFEDVSLPFEQPSPLLCVLYQFECGKGETRAVFVE